MKPRERGWRYALIILGAAVLLLMVIDFNGRMAELRRLTAEKERVGAQATRLMETNVYLETQITYATSESAVIQWAREGQHELQPGDQPFIPVAPANSTPVPTPSPVVTPKIVNNWDLWKALFINEPDSGK